MRIYAVLLLLASSSAFAQANDPESSLKSRQLIQDVNRVRAQILTCWKGTNVGSTAIDLLIKLKPDGGLDGVPVPTGRPTTPDAQKAVTVAVEAIQKCQPFEFNVSSYPNLKTVIITFDPLIWRNPPPPPTSEMISTHR